MSSVETGQVSAVETGQMSGAETGQMSAVETRQMSSVARTDICLVSTHNVEVSEVSTVPMLKSQKSPLSQDHNVEVSEVTIVAMSQCSSLRSLNCGNVTMFKCRQDVRIDPPACRGHFQASVTSPTTQNLAKGQK